MSTSSCDLFLGICVDETLEKQLLRCKPELIRLFTNGGLYLEQIYHENSIYLGKRVKTPTTTEELSLLQQNISTLLSRLLNKERVIQTHLFPMDR